MIVLLACVGACVLFLCGIGVGYSLNRRSDLRVSEQKLATLNNER